LALLNWVKPQALQKGSRIAIVSPSWGGPSIFPQIYLKGLNNLERLFGLQIVEYPSAKMSAEEVYKHPQKRAEDINQAFQAPDKAAILPVLVAMMAFEFCPI
jgi:muramoyltetrapeptide carboxypeptidase LdcA involved in peptidoglycan recycling